MPAIKDIIIILLLVRDLKLFKHAVVSLESGLMAGTQEQVWFGQPLNQVYRYWQYSLIPMSIFWTALLKTYKFAWFHMLTNFGSWVFVEFIYHKLTFVNVYFHGEVVF